VPAGQIAIGVLGCGGIASYYHLPILLAHSAVRVVAVADPAPAARERASAAAPGAAIESDSAAVLERSDVDAVVVCAENARHAELARASAAAGKHLYLEKPLALTLDDGRAVVDAAEAAGVTAMIGFNLRFHPAHAQAHALLRQGVLGQPRAVRAVFHEPARRGRMPAWKRARRTGGGALLDLASHTVDLVRWHLSTDVTEATASLRSHATEHDSALVRLSLASGTEASLDCRIGTTRADVLEIEGTEATLRVDRYGGGVQVLPGPRPLKPLAARVRGHLTRPAREPSFQAALDAWIARLRGEEAALPTLADGLRSLEVVLAAERSSG
jgi:predicted dehydrogenase